MRLEVVSAKPGVVAPLRMVLIPGAYQQPEDFRTAGFLDVVRERGLDVDIVLLEPELAYLTDRTPLLQLHHEVVLPARSAGSVALWVVGISMGAFLALLYAAEHPDALDGLCLLGPYLGSRLMSAELDNFESLASWSAATTEVHDELSEERRVWRFLATRPRSNSTRLYLGFGGEDRFAPAQRLAAERLPPDSIEVVSGGHEWSVWLELWNRFIDRLAGAPLKGSPPG